jgi:hypothetical protein
MVLSAEDSTTVEVTTYPAPPVVNNPWTFSLIVDYPYPDDVSVIEPPFPLSLDRIVKYSRRFDAKIQTVFEYRFIPSESGSFTIEAFTVICPDGVTKTQPFNLDISASKKERALPVLRLFWEINSKQISSLSTADSFQMTAGERILLILRANDRNSPMQHEYPPQEYFAPAAPQGAILAISPLSEGERAAGIMLKLTLIPLKGDFRLDARTLQHENFIFEIPPLLIRINEISAESDESSYITNTTRTENFKGIVLENTLPININVQKVATYNISRKFYIVLLYFIIILVILTPIVCFLLFKNEKK